MIRALLLLGLVLAEVALWHLDVSVPVSDHFTLINAPYVENDMALEHLTEGIVQRDVRAYQLLMPGVVVGRASDKFFIASADGQVEEYLTEAEWWESCWARSGTVPGHLAPASRVMGLFFWQCQSVILAIAWVVTCVMIWARRREVSPIRMRKCVNQGASAAMKQ